MTEYQVEFGSSQPIRFANPKCYDGDGNEIIIPKCEKCGYHKCQVIGKEALNWICLICSND